MESRCVRRSHVSKQTQGQSEDRCGGSGVLHPVREKQGENRGRQRKNIGWLKKPLEKKRKNGRKTRRVNRSMRRAARLKTKVDELTVGTFTVALWPSMARTVMAMPRRYWKSTGRRAVILSDCRRRGGMARTGSQQRGKPYSAVDLAEM